MKCIAMNMKPYDESGRYNQWRVIILLQFWLAMTVFPHIENHKRELAAQSEQEKERGRDRGREKEKKKNKRRLYA